MGQATEVMDRFLGAMEKGDMDTVMSLLDDDFDFAGPVAGTRGAAAFLEMLRNFNCSGMHFNFHARFENGDEACAIYDLTMTAPNGQPLTLTISDWMVVEGGRIVRERILYDPRPMLAAFGMDPSTVYREGGA